MASDPPAPNSDFERGRAAYLRRDLDGALALLHAAVARDPAHSAATMHLGAVCLELDRLDEAEDLFRGAVARDPANAAAWNNLAAILMERGDADGASAHYDAAIARDANYAEASSNRIVCEQFRADVTPERLLALSRAWDVRHGVTPVPALPRRSGGRLRVGFVSPDLCRAPVGYFLIGLLEALGDTIETIVYSDTLWRDDLTERLKRAAGTWQETRSLSHAAFIERARADQLDVLIDLAGHTRGNRLLAFARRAAPVQASWAGYAGTTGLAAMDALIADRHQVPDGDQRFYAERIARMPDGYVCYVPPEYAPAVGALPAQRQGHITFGAFHNVAKIGTRSLTLWAGVLAAVPFSRLVLKYRKLDDPKAAARILGAFAVAGIAEERITIEGTSAHVAMLQRYNDIDIALDALPYSGGLTTCESVWMGVPVVTLPGRTFAGRHTLSHLSTVGLTEFVARDEAGYVRIAASLARDTNALAAIRARLRPQMAASPLCDPTRFAKGFTELMGSLARW